MINLKLNQTLIYNFNRDGFIILEKFIERNFIKSLRERFKPLFNGKFETGIEPDEWNWKFDKDPIDVTRQICNAWKSDTLIKSFVCSENIGKVCAELMNWNGSKLIQDNILWKPPGGKTLGYHQDAAYDDWIIPQTMMTCWMSLDDTTKETGTLEYVKGSHKWGLQPPKGEFHSPEDYREQLKIFAKKNNKDLDIVYVEVPAGGVAFHHGYMWHGSGINTSDKHRRAIVSHCVPSDAKFHPTNNGGTAKTYKKYKKKNSDQLPDEFFPLLWKRD
jgi:ectoine hydroxylase-related dioxygenase (phytanoyl-CoA dioxygenase family)